MIRNVGLSGDRNVDFSFCNKKKEDSSTFLYFENLVELEI